MQLVLLALSLLVLLVGVLLASPGLFAFAIVSSIVSLTAVPDAPRWALLSFCLWVNLVLLYLVSEPSADAENVRLVAGFPMPALWMLLGIWLIPIIIWPLAFLIGFRKWMSR